MPTGHRKLEKLSELIGKLQEIYYRFTEIVRTNSNGTAIRRHEWLTQR